MEQTHYGWQKSFNPIMQSRNLIGSDCQNSENMNINVARRYPQSQPQFSHYGDWHEPNLSQGFENSSFWNQTPVGWNTPFNMSQAQNMFTREHNFAQNQNQFSQCGDWRNDTQKTFYDPKCYPQYQGPMIHIDDRQIPYNPPQSQNLFGNSEQGQAQLHQNFGNICYQQQPLQYHAVGTQNPCNSYRSENLSTGSVQNQAQFSQNAGEEYIYYRQQAARPSDGNEYESRSENLCADYRSQNPEQSRAQLHQNFSPEFICYQQQPLQYHAVGTQNPCNPYRSENLSTGSVQNQAQFSQNAGEEYIYYRQQAARPADENNTDQTHLSEESGSTLNVAGQPFASYASRESDVITDNVSCDPQVSSVASVTEECNGKEDCRLVNFLTYLYDLPEDDVGPSKVEDEVDSHDQNTSVSETIEMVKIQPKQKLGCDNRLMFVKTSDQRGKKLCCPFCDKLVSKFARHLEDIHSGEEDVQRFLSFPKFSTQRHAIQNSLKKIGLLNFSKNAALNENQLIPIRRPNLKHKKTSAINFTTCPYCYGPYAKSGIYYHIKYKCPNKPIADERTEGERVTTALSTAIEGRYHVNASSALEKIFHRFKDDDVVRAIKFDWLAILYGNKLASKYTKRNSSDMIKNRLRLMGRFILAIKEIEPEITDLASIYVPKYYDRVVDAIRAVAKVDPVRNEFIAPATASSAVTAIRQIGRHLVSAYIQRDDQEKQRVTNNFLTVMNDDMHISINKMVIETQSRKARQKVVVLPSSEDVKLLSNYIEDNRKYFYTKLLESFAFKDWLQLTGFTMASIIVYNRRRVGDTQNILGEDFTFKENINEKTNDELLSALSEQSREVANQFSRMKVRGKKNRTVPVLLKADVDDCLKLLISHRQKAGVPSENIYLFGLPSKIDNKRVVDAGRVLGKYAKACGAKNPLVLTATNLRKHLATICVRLQLSDTCVADVAEFMGHHEKVHREYYRQNTIDRQIVQMSHVLEAAQGGSMGDYDNWMMDGKNSLVDGENLMINGKSSVPNGGNSVVDGENLMVNGKSSVPNGRNSVVDGENLMINGKSSVPNGGNSVVDGENLMVNGKSSVPNGRNSVVDGENLMINGKSSIPKGGNSVVNGKNPVHKSLTVNSSLAMQVKNGKAFGNSGRKRKIISEDLIVKQKSRPAKKQK